MLIISHSDMLYHNAVMGLVTRSISNFSLHVGHDDTPLHSISGILPDIWVDGKKLYQCQTLEDDGGRWRYSLSFQELLDPYRYVEDNVSVITTLLAPW